MSNQIKAKVILHSVAKNTGAEIFTLQLRYHRFIHGEFMTHRVFSRNAGSSRAIPVKKVLSQVWNDPAMPINWGANQPGMQAKSQLTGLKLWMARTLWKTAAKSACAIAWAMNKAGLHKQVANRILEPFQLIEVIVTATEWENFFALRDHPDAQPEIQELARQMREAMRFSIPQVLNDDQWHLPYVTEQEIEHELAHYGHYDRLLEMSAARCARVSYLLHDGAAPSMKKDFELFAKLVGSKPLHASPIEHQAKPAENKNHQSNNFKGWVQFRRVFEFQ